MTEDQRRDRRAGLTWAVSTAVVVMGVSVVALGAIWAYGSQKALLRERTEQTLKTIVYFKTQGIKEWYKQCLSGASGVCNLQEINKIFSKGKETLPAQYAAARDALNLHAQRHGFVACAFLDSGGELLTWSIGGDSRYLDGKPVVFGSSGFNEPWMSPLHTFPGGLPHLDIVVPLPARSSISGPAAALFSLDPWKSVFRKMITAPKTLPSLDTYLVQEVNGKVEYFTPLQGGTIPPLAFKTPCRQENDVENPSLRALRGDYVTGEGTDYRGVAVVYATNYVPWTHWGVVGTLDQDEAYASLQLIVLLATGLSTLALLAAVTIVYAWWNRRHARTTAALAAELAAQKTTLQTMVRRLFSAQLDERRRISLEVHDGMAQSLGCARLALQEIESPPKDEAESVARENIVIARSCVEAAEADCRLLLNRYRPPELDRLGLVEAIRALTSSLSVINLHFWPRDEISLRDLSPEVSLALYHIAQEALNNIRKHAKATEAHVTLGVEEGHAFLEVLDDGQGFRMDQQPQPLHFGLDCMQERARYVGGVVSVESWPEKGTRIIARLPLRLPTPYESPAESLPQHMPCEISSLAPPAGESDRLHSQRVWK